MKKVILVFWLMLTMVTTAFAGEVCGTVGRQAVGPHCTPGQMCPMYLMLVYNITANNGEVTRLQFGNPDVLTQVFDRVEKTVCVQGEETAAGFQVTEITDEN